MNKDKIKEYMKRFETGCSNTQGVGHASDCEECLEAFAEAVDKLYTPKPSSDFTTPKSTPYKKYLLWEEGFDWGVGYWNSGWKQFAIVDEVDGGEIFCRPSYWLPLPLVFDQDA